MPGTERSLTLRFLAEPTDINFGGKVHGGAAMKWIDLAAYACASAWSGKYCITAYMGGMRFVKPIHVGHMVEVDAKVIYTGRTSMHLGIEVRSGPPTSVTKELTTHCVAIMVAVDEQGRPTQVPEWVPQTQEDIAMRESAIRLIQMRAQIADEMQSYLSSV
ncbi:acyl-CoA thioesterase [Cellvibrio japonicus]|uniref:Cytosolic long-chain acyl-CoA thioester hydrolase family protein n=1 Tax=Cellvibrio japonicus (strain Ueda107) TaxID=498211 RepID=B3PB21_CELJU|nr:acyl-CoA thioesterase [Cellvibrio japonicus]ACE85808.1 cytosolic long-chain acyl-CoA thioester hydrolase family protein [Cellvibrio japonicus Ueda107]QEI11616.1 acyl-CoA thioesterase [Cellvibrio japonicus]QEI15190.1 acyl-CoA thioesterase [Cellvibrio japonicus]QEI18770.1 acyl-CoA thioesterase [Cellvibrio japonicus]